METSSSATRKEELHCYLHWAVPRSNLLVLPFSFHVCARFIYLEFVPSFTENISNAVTISRDFLVTEEMPVNDTHRSLSDT